MNQLVSGMLDQYFADIWLEGEVSNVKHYPSGHIYFTLKDATSQLNAVCFRSAAQQLKFRLTDGLLVIAHGRIEVYVAAGRYQAVLDEIHPKGQGALQLAFEQLKQKLAAEGLFDKARKKPLPALPGTVALVTSPSGAAVHDILKTLRRLRAKLRVLLYPVAVQGEGAAEQIAEAIRQLNQRDDIDVIITGRGGGSIEDLWPFNEEIVARAIAASRIPVISAVGHEVDYTIADFVADVRAATPTAAAQIVAQGWQDLTRRLAEDYDGLLSTMEQLLAEQEQRLDARLQRIERNLRQLKARAESRVRSLLDRAQSSLRRSYQRRRTVYQQFLARLNLLSRQLGEQQQQVAVLLERIRHRVVLQRITADNRLRRLFRGLVNNIRVTGQQRKAVCQRLVGRLDVLSPLSSLARGYAICQQPDGRIVTRVAQVAPGENVNVRVSDGNLACEVVKTEELKPEGGGL